MQLDPILRADIQAAERCVLTAYKDTQGYWTVGWGHKLPEGHDWSKFEVTQGRATFMLDDDIFEAGHGALSLPEWKCLDGNRARENALVELVFNMGLTKWKTFTKTRNFLSLQNWKSASDELKDSLWYRQVGKTRGDRLADYLLTGSYPPSVAGSSSYASSSLAWPHGSAGSVN